MAELMPVITNMQTDDPVTWPDSRLIFEINTRHSDAEESASQALQSALRLGELLMVAKGRIEHGGWEAWLRDNTKLAVRTCQAYMRLARHHAGLNPLQAQRVAELPVREAIRAIATEAAPDRSQTPRIYIPARSDRDRLNQQFKKSATEIKNLALRVCFGEARGKDIDRAKRVLQAALDALDKLVVEHGEQDAEGGQNDA